MKIRKNQIQITRWIGSTKMKRLINKKNRLFRKEYIQTINVANVGKHTNEKHIHWTKEYMKFCFSTTVFSAEWRTTLGELDGWVEGLILHWNIQTTQLWKQRWWWFKIIIHSLIQLVHLVTTPPYFCYNCASWCHPRQNSVMACWLLLNWVN